MSARDWRRRDMQAGQPGRSAGCNGGRFLRVRTDCTSRLHKVATEGLWALSARKAGWFGLARSRRPGGDVTGEEACCPTSRCAQCGCRCCRYFGDIVGTGGASSVPGELATDGPMDRASRHIACRLPASIRVSFSPLPPPLPLVSPKNMHAHIYTCTYIYTSVHIYLYPYMHKYIHTYIHTYIHKYIHTYLYTYINTYINKSIYLYMCAYT